VCRHLLRLAGALSIFFGLLSFSSITLAAEAGSRSIEEVIVTAERREASIQDTSISITAFTGQFLEDFGIRNQEDLQNFIPATTIQPYDATVRGVGRQFRALGGDPGVATYVNGVYSEDLISATAATFWDVERIEVLRGPQGTLYGRNAVGGAINILYKEPTDEFEASLKGIVGNFGTQEYYGALSGPLIEGVLSGRVNFSYRERDGVVEEIGGGPDLDGLDTESVAIQFRWTPTDTLEFNVRHNRLDVDRPFGGADGAGLVVLNEEGVGTRNTTALVSGFRFIDSANTDIANFDQNNFNDTSQQTFTFTNPLTGVAAQAQRIRPGIDFVSDFNGFQNAAASLDGFNNTSAASAAAQNECVFSGDISGSDICAASNGLNNEDFEQQGNQFSVAWDVSDTVQLKYIFGYSEFLYQRISDDDNTASQFQDRQFYVSQEAQYVSHELQAFVDFSDSVSVTSGIFFYDATLDQRGDFFSTLESSRFRNPYVDNTSLSAGAAALIGAPGLEGISASALAFGGAPPVSLFSARDGCAVVNPAPSCATNFAVDNVIDNNNLVTSVFIGDNGTSDAFNVSGGPDTAGTDLLYETTTERKAFAAYTQGVWDINDSFTLTLGVRYASDEVTAEENLFRYSETGAEPGGFLGLFGGLAAVNRVNGGLVDDGSGNLIVPTELVTNGGIPFALSVFRPFERKDEKVTGRINLDWDVSEDTLIYFSATSGFRSGGYNLVFFSNTPTYDPEELLAYEIGYKTQFFDNTLQVNGSFYFYDYDTIHTSVTESSALGGTTNSVQEAPGAEIFGVEADVLWLATDRLTFGGNFSFTHSEYSEDAFFEDESVSSAPESLFPGAASLAENINGNQVLQVPELKFSAWATYTFALDGGSSLAVSSFYSWIDEVFYSPFESDFERTEAYGRADLRTTWTSADNSFVVSGFVNNIFDDVGILQVLRNGEDEFFRQSGVTTLPRHYGLEFTYSLGAN